MIVLIRAKQAVPVIAALILTLWSGGGLAVSLAETIPVPDGLSTYLIGEGIKHNGVAFDVLYFSHAGAPAEIVDFYRLQWQQGLAEDQPGVMLDRMQDWHLISRVELGHLYLVQVRQAKTGGAEGYMSVRSLESFSKTADLPGKLPILGGSQVVSVTESIDRKRKATTVILINHHSVDANSRFFVEQALRLGWQNVSSPEQRDEGVLRFATPESQIDLAMRRNSQGLTVIFINSVDSAD